jgi:hypothetical protein
MVNGLCVVQPVKLASTCEGHPYNPLTKQAQCGIAMAKGLGPQAGMASHIRLVTRLVPHAAMPDDDTLHNGWAWTAGWLACWLSGRYKHWLPLCSYVSSSNTLC